MDIERALLFVTTDERWVQKLVIAAIIYAASLIPVVGMLFGLVFIGYSLEITRNVYQGVDVPLPEWNGVGEYFVRGLVAVLGAFVWMLPAVVIAICVTMGAVAADPSGSRRLSPVWFSPSLSFWSSAFSRYRS